MYVTDIYAAGEKAITGITSKIIVDGIRKTGIMALPFPGALEAARDLRPGDVVLTLGAGDVWKIGEDLLRRRRGGSAVGV